MLFTYAGKDKENLLTQREVLIINFITARSELKTKLFQDTKSWKQASVEVSEGRMCKTKAWIVGSERSLKWTDLKEN